MKNAPVLYIKFVFSLSLHKTYKKQLLLLKPSKYIFMIL